MKPSLSAACLLAVVLVVCAGVSSGPGLRAQSQKPPASAAVAGLQNPSFEETDGKTAVGWRSARFDRARPDLVLSIVNPTATAQTLTLDLTGARLPASGHLWRIAGTDEKAYNEPGKPPAIVVQETASAPAGRSLVVPAMSISLLELTVTPPAKKTTEVSR